MSLPAKDICSLDRGTVPPIRRVRILPLSISLRKPPRKRLARTTRSPRRGESWTRRAAVACVWLPEALTFVITNLRELTWSTWFDNEDEITTYREICACSCPIVTCRVPCWKIIQRHESLITLAPLSHAISSFSNGKTFLYFDGITGAYYSPARRAEHNGGALWVQSLYVLLYFLTRDR